MIWPKTIDTKTTLKRLGFKNTIEVLLRIQRYFRFKQLIKLLCKIAITFNLTLAG